MAEPGHDGLFGKTQSLGYVRQFEIDLPEVVEYHVAANLVVERSARLSG